MEYRVEVIGSALRGAKSEELEAMLNQVAQEGWELAELIFKTNTSQLWVVLQRQVEGERSRKRSRSWLSDWS